MKIMRIHPNVGAIVGNINRQIAHQANAAVSAVFVQLAPLGKERELLELLHRDRFCQSLAPARERRRLSPSNAWFPSAPDSEVVILLERHEQRKVIQPSRIGLAE